MNHVNCVCMEPIGKNCGRPTPEQEAAAVQHWLNSIDWDEVKRQWLKLDNKS